MKPPPHLSADSIATQSDPVFARYIKEQGREWQLEPGRTFGRVGCHEQSRQSSFMA